MNNDVMSDIAPAIFDYIDDEITCDVDNKKAEWSSRCPKCHNISILCSDCFDYLQKYVLLTCTECKNDFTNDDIEWNEL